MSVEEDTRPKLAELCNELAHLQLAKTRVLVVQLCKISPDDIDYAPVEERRHKYCRFWLEKDPRATWTKLVKALIAPSLEEFTLAEDIRRKYCPWLPEIILGTTPEFSDEPRLQKPRSSTTISREGERSFSDVVKEHVSERIFYDSDVPIESMTLDGTPIQEYREYQKGLRLITACREHDMEGVTRILASGVDPNSRNTEQETPLTVACAEGYADAVLALLNANADINLKENDLAPLNIASYNGRTEVVKVLLGYRNCIVDILDEDDHSPLHRACFNGHTNVVQLLIKHSADYLRTCSDGSTALHQAANNGNYETVNFLLLECNFPVNVTDNKKETPLHWASYEGQVEVMELLIEARRELINSQDDAGLTPLMMAANKGYVNGVKLLVNYQANVDAQNKEGLTALMMASQQGHEEIVNTLINAKADVNICENSIGWSAVFLSAKEGHLDITKQLISAGANIALRDKYDTTAMDQAIVHGRTSLYPLLAPGKLQKETAVHQPSAIVVSKVMKTSEKIKEKLKRLDNWLKSTVKKEEFYRKQSQKSMEESSSQTLHA